MVNKDILSALELLTHKGFSENARIKHITRKNINDNLKAKKLFNKNILIIDKTGDIVFDVIKYNPRKIDCLLKNTFSKYYIELKIVFMMHNNYSNYINFFVKTKDNNNLFNYDAYYKISLYLSEATRLFWDALYENVNYDGLKIRNSDLFEQKLYDIDEYTNSKKFECIKNNLTNLKIDYINDFKDNEYDYVIINNTLDSEVRYNDIEKKCKKILI